MAMAQGRIFLYDGFQRPLSILYILLCTDWTRRIYDPFKAYLQRQFLKPEKMTDFEA